MDGPDVSLRGAEHLRYFERIRVDGHGAARGRFGQAPVSLTACRGCDRRRRVSDECSGTGDCRETAASTRRADLAGQWLRGHSMETADEVRKDFRCGIQ